MGFHTFDPSNAGKLEDAAARYRYLSAEELRWALDPDPTDTVADLGSGTGFYTDDVAPHVSTLYAVDIQPEMHELYREKGVPESVELVTSGIEDLPFDDAALDGAFSTNTYHEFASADALSELARVVTTGGRLVVADWSADGDGVAGPPVDERFSLGDATSAVEDSGFDVEFAADRPETFLVVAIRP